MKKRFANIELLRIIAMLFVIVLHYLGKGGTLLAWGDDNFTVNSYIAWAVEAFALVAVNVYVLISGYFLVDSRFKMIRIVKLWLQILFYSAGIWLIFLLLGLISVDNMNAYWISMYFLPVTSQHYWFASTYIFMCILAPFLSIAAHKMSKKQLRTCIVVLLLLFSRVWRILLPMSAAIDDRGYGILWFVCLFMVSAYIRLYVPITGKWKKTLLLYVVCSALLFLSLPIIGIFTQMIGKMTQYYNVLYEYNAPFTIIGAIALFLTFRNINVSSEKVGKVINWFAAGTFGVYLLHEHTLLRGAWDNIWKVKEYYSTSLFVFHMIIVVFVVFLVGCIIDWLRRLLFAGLDRILCLQVIEGKISKIDYLFNESTHITGKEEREKNEENKKTLENP